MSRALMIDPIIGLACGVTHFGLDFRLSEIRFLPQLFLIKPPKVSTKWHCRLNESTSFNSQGMILNGFQKIIFQNRYVALGTPSRPPILNFHFDYPHTSLIYHNCILLICNKIQKSSIWAFERRSIFLEALDGVFCVIKDQIYLAWFEFYPGEFVHNRKYLWLFKTKFLLLENISTFWVFGKF